MPVAAAHAPRSRVSPCLAFRSPGESSGTETESQPAEAREQKNAWLRRGTQQKDPSRPPPGCGRRDKKYLSRVQETSKTPEWLPTRIHEDPQKRGAAITRGAPFSCAPGMARSAMIWRLEPASESEPGSDLEVKVLWRPLWWELLAEQQLRRREAWWEGSCKQTAGPTNRNCIRGERKVGEGA